ncbi:MAG: virulence promoting factor [Enterobacter sp.]
MCWEIRDCLWVVIAVLRAAIVVNCFTLNTKS